MLKLTPGDLIGPYTLVKKLGGRQFSDVWLAERRGRFATTQVALKIIREEFQDQNEIARESQLWAQLGTHPNILPIIEADIYNDVPVIVTEYVPDGSLDDWLQKHKGLAPTIESALSMALGIVIGLAHLHSKNIVHRDLKPANIMLAGEIPRLTDFGVSRQLTSENTHSIAGTPAYMAPEMFDGKRSPQVDIWSMGVLLYKMLCGKLPFPQNGVALIYAVSMTEPDPMPKTIPILLRQIVIKALSKDPGNRYTSGAEMKVALEVAQKEMLKSELQLNVSSSTVPNKTLLKPVIWVSTPNKKEIRSGAFKSLPNFSDFPFETVLLDKTGMIAARYSRTTRYFKENLTETVKLEMVEIPPGTFLMGSDKFVDSDSQATEEPRHAVKIPIFYMSKYLITQAQWVAIMQDNPSCFQVDGNLNLPVEQVSWFDVGEFCQRLSIKTGRYYHLPSEAQWEYAARAGTTSTFAFGETITSEIVNFNANFSLGVAPKGIYRKHTSTVGQLAFANAFGLYDCHGNLWEWCQDVYHRDYQGAPANEQAWEQGGDPLRRVLRGGAWISSGLMCRSAFRESSIPDKASNTIGFRIVVSL